MRKHKSEKGFTLAELLIVVAIIAILVAIAVPVFSAQLEKARERVDEANIRSANSMAVAHYLSAHSDVSGEISCLFSFDESGNLILCCGLDFWGESCNKGFDWSAFDDTPKPKSKKYQDIVGDNDFCVIVQSGEVIWNYWTDGPVGQVIP